MLRIAFVVLFLIASYLLLSPSEKLPNVEVSDKVAHVIAFLTLMFNAGLAFGRKNYLLCSLLLIAYGILVEVLQPLVNRHSSIYDMLANLSGVVLALLLLYLIDKKVLQLLNIIKIRP